MKLVPHQVKGGLLLDVVVGESSSVLELLSSEDQTLLVRGDSLLVLDSNLQIIIWQQLAKFDLIHKKSLVI